MSPKIDNLKMARCKIMYVTPTRFKTTFEFLILKEHEVSTKFS